MKLCIEPHTGDCVYNTQTFLRLRREVGPTIGMNLDPSHLWWQGIDPIVFVETIGEAIYTCHVKDVALDPRLTARDGLASSAYYDEWDLRSWSYRTLGYGHDEFFWRNFIVGLRRAGYDGPLSIECEEPYPHRGRLAGQGRGAAQIRPAQRTGANRQLDGRLPVGRLREEPGGIGEGGDKGLPKASGVPLQKTSRMEMGQWSERRLRQR